MQGGKDHTSHRLVSLGLSQRAAVLTLYAVSVALGLVGVALSTASIEGGLRIGAGVGLVAVAAFLFLEHTYIRSKRAP